MSRKNLSEEFVRGLGHQGSEQKTIYDGRTQQKNSLGGKVSRAARKKQCMAEERSKRIRKGVRFRGHRKKCKYGGQEFVDRVRSRGREAKSS